MGSLSLRPDYGVDSNPALPRGTDESNSDTAPHISSRSGSMNLVRRVAMQYLGAVEMATPIPNTRNWKPTGDGTRVGLFIPLPENLASMFPKKDEDTSPPHVTFLIVGNVPKAREQEFVDVVNQVLQKEPSPIRAKIGGIDRFVHATEEVQETVFFSQVTFSRDVAEVRDRVWSALTDAGFEVADEHPYAYIPHVTLAYVPGANRPNYHGPVPSGNWNFNSIHIWGLSKPYAVQLGSFYGKNVVPFPVLPAKYASLDMGVFTNKYVQGIQEYARLLSLHETTLNDLMAKADHKRIGRVGDVRVTLTNTGQEVVEAKVSGRTGNYDSRITFLPKRGFRCTCPDFLQNGPRMGPCKHVLAVATEWQTRILAAEDALQARLDIILEREFASKQASRIAHRYLSSAVPAKYDHIDFTPPASVAAEAKKGLEYRQKASPSNKGGLTPAEAAKQGIGSGVQRAVNLKNRDTLSPETIRQMHSFFARHEKNKTISPENKGNPWNDKGYVAWLLWGGDAGQSWASKIVRQMDAADAKEKKASRFASAEHARSIALMKFLSSVARRLGVAEHIYVVGGAVRNFLLDVPIKDIDVVVDSIGLGGKDSAWFAAQVERNIPVASNVVTNQYGVAILTVKGNWMLDGINMNGEVIEIANARKESYSGAGGKGKGYKPEEVLPATIEEDVLRRELTFNTLLWRLLDLAEGPEKAEVIDITGLGRQHLEERLLKTPRDPDIVFSDDPTRMLRLLKFQARYNLKIPDDVLNSVRKNAPKLLDMPWEAVGNILVNDILSKSTARAALKIMVSLNLIPTLRKMIQENKAFAAYIARQLRDIPNVQLMLDLVDLGFGANTPIGFLDPQQQQVLREITVSMDEADAEEYVKILRQPPIDNMALIEEFNIPPNQRKGLQERARKILLEHPRLAGDPRRLTEAVRRTLQ